MGKTETVHTRVSPEIKRQADAIFNSIGLTTSQAISLFLTAVINNRGIPFPLTVPDESDEEAFRFASSIATVDGVAPSEEGKRIFMLYKRGEIDYETAQFALARKFGKKDQHI